MKILKNYNDDLVLIICVQEFISAQIKLSILINFVRRKKTSIGNFQWNIMRMLRCTSRRKAVKANEILNEILVLWKKEAVVGGIMNFILKTVNYLYFKMKMINEIMCDT